MNEVKLIILPPSDIVLSESELSARLHMPPDQFPSCLDQIVEEVRNNIECKCAYSEIDFSIENKTDVVFPSTNVESKSLVKFLQACQSCIFTVVTLGMGVERLLSSIPDENASERLIADAASSAFVESACDLVQDIINNEYGELSGRFSPGYGDLSLDFQPILLETLNARRLLGVTLNDSLMMIPRKTVSSIIGVKTNELRSTAKEN